MLPTVIKNGILIVDILDTDRNLSETRQCFILFLFKALSFLQKKVKSFKWQKQIYILSEDTLLLV